MRTGIRLAGWVRTYGLLGLALTLGVAGCRRGGADVDIQEDSTTGGGATQAAAEEPGPPPADWPRVLVTGPGSGPALYLGHSEEAPAIGYLNPGVRVRLESSLTNGRVEVLVGGSLAVKAWVPLQRVGLYTQQRGRIEGTRAYVGPGDFVGLLGPGEEPGHMRVEVRPWMGGGNFLGPFVGTYAADQLGDEPPAGDVEGVTPGECFTLPAGETITLTERPQGEAVANLPALDPPLSVVVLRQRNDLFGVRAGYGPYLTGYVQGGLTPCEGELPAPEPAAVAGEGGRPYWMSQERGPLHRVAAGTRVGFHGRTIARLRSEGWARELGRQENGLVDVFVAVDDNVAIRGLVREGDLTLVEGQPTAPTPEPEPEEELPDELQ